jgi:hypothetical protein
MGKERKVYEVWWENPKERNCLKDQGIGGKMGSEWILGGGGMWIGFD